MIGLEWIGATGKSSSWTRTVSLLELVVLRYRWYEVSTLFRLIIGLDFGIKGYLLNVWNREKSSLGERRKCRRKIGLGRQGNYLVRDDRVQYISRYLPDY